MKGKSWILGIIVIASAFALILFKRNIKTHKDIVINANGQEYIVDSYTKHNDCIIFDYDGKTKTICGNFEIIE
jgi:hypothetical protein